MVLLNPYYQDNKKDSSSTFNCDNQAPSTTAENVDSPNYVEESGRDFWNEINFSLCNRKLSTGGSESSTKSNSTADAENDEASTKEPRTVDSDVDSGNDSAVSSQSPRSQSPNSSEYEFLNQRPSTQECTCDMSQMIGYKFLKCSCSLDSATTTSSSTTNKPKTRKNNKKLNNKNFMSASLTTTTKMQQQFSRSSVGGSKFLLSCHPTLEPSDLIFESRFESGNLAKAVKITPTYYELYLRPDMYTNRHTQWFYFRVKNTKKNVVYR